MKAQQRHVVQYTLLQSVAAEHVSVFLMHSLAVLYTILLKQRALHHMYLCLQRATATVRHDGMPSLSKTVSVRAARRVTVEHLTFRCACTQWNMSVVG